LILLPFTQANVSHILSNTLMVLATCAMLHAEEDVSDWRTVTYATKTAMAGVPASVLTSAQPAPPDP